MRIEGDSIIFSSGKEMCANNGIVGIGRGDNSFYISEGYDGDLDIDKMTCEEKKELADYMIEMWTSFKHSNQN